MYCPNFQTQRLLSSLSWGKILMGEVAGSLVVYFFIVNVFEIQIIQLYMKLFYPRNKCLLAMLLFLVLVPITFENTAKLNTLLLVWCFLHCHCPVPWAYKVNFAEISQIDSFHLVEIAQARLIIYPVYRVHGFAGVGGRGIKNK